MQNDNRAVSEDFFNKLYQKDGIYYPFYQFVKRNLDQLTLCFRGNGTPQKIIIYHNNHTVWELYGDADRIGISFNHARYCADWKKYRDELGKLGFNIKDRFGKDIEPDRSGSIGTLMCDCTSELYKKNPMDFVKRSYEILMEIMRVFFTPKSKYDFDYYKNKETNQKRNLAEKRWQQRLFNDLKFKNDGLFAYDLEFSQPNGSKIGESNEPDMLALRYEDGKPRAIVLVEVKSLYSACAPSSNAKSHIFAHLNGMKKYAESSNIKNRCIEAHYILDYYKRLGLYVDENQMIPDEDIMLPVECVVIFTTADLVDIGIKTKSSESAIHYYLNYKKEIDELVNKDDWRCSVLCVGDYEGNRKYPKNKYVLPKEWS